MAEPAAPFLPFARRIKSDVRVPVIAVGRLGDPAMAMAAVDDGDCDFVALGRPLLADPEWPAKAARGIPVRRCIACNTCVDEMRGGARIGCLVNGRAGREHELPAKTAIAGERIAVIGAGPAGLSYAALVADANAVTVFERGARTGGALRHAALAPLFQAVTAAEPPIRAYLDDLEAACRQAGVTIHLASDPLAQPARLAAFDRVVIATGANYRLGIGPLVRLLLERGMAKRGPLRRLLEQPYPRDWFYHRARRPSGEKLAAAIGTGPAIEIIGDARTAGKAKPAITSAFEAALRTPTSPRPAQETRA